MGRTATLRSVAAAAMIASLLLVVKSAGQAEAAEFQARRQLDCSGTPIKCRATFGEVDANKRLTITFVSCFLQGNQEVELPKAAFLGINNALSDDQFRHALIWEIRDAGNLSIILVSQPVLVQVGAGKRPDIAIPFIGESAPNGNCSISGELANSS